MEGAGLYSLLFCACLHVNLRHDTQSCCNISTLSGFLTENFGKCLGIGDLMELSDDEDREGGTRLPNALPGQVIQHYNILL